MLTPRLSLTAVFVSALFASAGAVLVLEHVGLIHPAARRAEPIHANSARPEMPLVADQASGIETGSLPAREPVPQAPADITATATAPEAGPLRWDTLTEASAESPTGEDPETWGTETLTQSSPLPPAPTSEVAAPPVPVTRVAAPAPPAQQWQNSLSVAAARPVTLQERLAEISPAAVKRLKEKFQTANAAWPPDNAALVAIKDKKIVELYARAKDGAWTFIHRYRVLAASGAGGPKLRQGDKQVPEGVYGISFLNPNSKYHVALRVNYPNAFDREMAAKDGRKSLGGDIMIHGKAVSIGCLAVGDEASEELFVLAAEVGLPNVKLVIAPVDFRRDGLPGAAPGQPQWLPKLYAEVATAMADFKAPASTGLLSFFEN
ncbi:MAG: hypothetical protein ABL907_11285 [Hyphomicrobium sp.]